MQNFYAGVFVSVSHMSGVVQSRSKVPLRFFAGLTFTQASIASCRFPSAAVIVWVLVPEPGHNAASIGGDC